MQLLFRALIGGTFVATFALLGEILMPKRFAGVFSAAPSVALGNLIVSVLAKGVGDAAKASRGMVVGAVAFIVAAIVGSIAVRRERAVLGSLVVCGVWLAIAAALLGAAG